MKLQTEWVEYEAEGKKVRGYLARPSAAQGALPGVLVIQEVFGVDPHIQDVTERFAAAGYAAFAPDLFSHGGKPAPLMPDRIEDAKQFLDTLPQPAWFDPAQRAPALAALPEARRKALEETLGLLLVPNRPWDQYVAIMRAGRAWLAAGPAKGQKIGSVGFCMGGALSLRLACSEPELGAAVVFYGSAPPLEMLAGLKCPVLGLYAEQDPRINAGVPALADALKAQGKQFEHHIYPGAKHAFLNDTRANYQADAARGAWARTLSFFASHLASL
jgi:carboxymethylenebutenolidase